MENTEQRSLLVNLKVLYVEDEDFTREELSRFLKRRVGKLHLAKNGQEGLEAMQAFKPDFIITDLKMPFMDGLEMTKAIRQLGLDTPVIVISALSDSDTILKAVDLGIVKYVVKPVNTKELSITMEKLALDILKNKQNQSILNDRILIDKEQKQELEKKIKGEMAHFIKSYTGKGPKDIRVFIQGNQIEVRAEGVLTLLELNILANHRNHSLVNYNRRLFYIENRDALEKQVGEGFGSRIELVEVEVDSDQNLDKITFSF